MLTQPISLPPETSFHASSRVSIDEIGVSESAVDGEQQHGGGAAAGRAPARVGGGRDRSG